MKCSSSNKDRTNKLNFTQIGPGVTVKIGLVQTDIHFALVYVEIFEIVSKLKMFNQFINSDKAINFKIHIMSQNN